MKRVLLLIAILMALSVPLQAFSDDYRRLTDGCHHYESKGNVAAYRECVADVSAVEDILRYWANYNIHACISPDSVASGQFAAVVNKSLSQHPEVTGEGISALVAVALSNDFPCER